MNDRSGEFGSGISAIVEMEKQIAAALAATSSEVARAECFDAEQRSEIYVILETMTADSQTHCSIVGRWINDRTGQARNV
jgi:hypothetical protein